MANRASRNGEIELLRFVFAVFVVLRHAPEYGDSFSGGSLGVDFFFLLSGFLMLKSMSKLNNQEISTARLETSFLLHKLGSFFPELLLSVCLGGLMFALAHTDQIGLAIARMEHSVFSDILLLKATGLVQWGGGFNDPVWYLSSMMMGIALLFPLFRKYGCRLEWLALTILGLGALLLSTHELTWPNFELLGTNKGNIRGILELSLGCFCYYAVKAANRYEFSTLLRTLLTIAKYAAIAFIMYAIISGNTHLHGKMLVASAFTIMATMSGQTYGTRLFTNKLCCFLGRMSLPLYLAHVPVLYISRRVGLELFGDISSLDRLYIYLALSLMMCIVLYYGGQAIRRFFASLPAGTFVRPR